MESPYYAAAIIALALFLFQVTALLNEDPITGIMKDESAIQVNTYITNSTSHHIYPYLASFITFVCIFTSLMMVICFAPLLN
jgi:hypothetical protein